MNKVLLYFLFFTFSGLIYAQNNYQPGYIIINESDTVQGFIDFKMDIENQKQCCFKRDLNQKEEELYHPGNILGYRFENGKFYVTKSINIENEELLTFIEYLVQGMLNLYYYESETQKYYLFEDEKGKETLITQKPEQIIDHNKVLEDNKYKGVIKYSFRNSEAVTKKADKINFNQKSFIDIVKTYHEDVCKTGENCVVFKKQKVKDENFAIKYSVYGGMKRTVLSFGRDDEMYDSKSLSPNIGVQVELINLRWTKSLSLIADIGFTSIKNETDVFQVKLKDRIYSYKYDYKMSMLTGITGVRYSYRTKSISPFLEAGFSYVCFLSNEGNKTIIRPVNVKETHKFDIQKYCFGIYGGIGFNIHLNKTPDLYVKLSMENYLDMVRNNSPDNYLILENKLRLFQLNMGITF